MATLSNCANLVQHCNSMIVRTSTSRVALCGRQCKAGNIRPERYDSYLRLRFGEKNERHLACAAEKLTCIA